MTKEPIIIDGVDVSIQECIQECIFWQEGHCDCYNCADRYPHCLDFPNCYYKQLARKTQECEKLKQKIETYKCSQNCYKYIEADRYRKALEEISEFINNDMCEPCKELEENSCDECNYSIILDIISKAKEKEEA